MQMQSYQTLLETSRRINWRVDDLIGGDKRLDFSRPFLPETFARTAPLTFLSAEEKLRLLADWQQDQARTAGEIRLPSQRSPGTLVRDMKS